VFKNNISNGVESQTDSNGTPLDPPLFRLNNIFKQNGRLGSCDIFTRISQLMMIPSKTVFAKTVGIFDQLAGSLPPWQKNFQFFANFFSPPLRQSRY
jgi:hypothetical protein